MEKYGCTKGGDGGPAAAVRGHTGGVQPCKATCGLCLPSAPAPLPVLTACAFVISKMQAPPQGRPGGGLSARDVTSGVAHRRGRCSKSSGYAVALA